MLRTEQLGEDVDLEKIASGAENLSGSDLKEVILSFINIQIFTEF